MGHMDTCMVHVPLHVSGLILHGSFSNQFKQGLGDYYGCFMLIRRALGHLSAIFKYLKYMKIFHHGWAPYYGIMVRAFTSISLLSVGISL